MYFEVSAHLARSDPLPLGSLELYLVTVPALIGIL